MPFLFASLLIVLVGLTSSARKPDAQSKCYITSNPFTGEHRTMLEMRKGTELTEGQGTSDTDVRLTASKEVLGAEQSSSQKKVLVGPHLSENAAPVTALPKAKDVAPHNFQKTETATNHQKSDLPQDVPHELGHTLLEEESDDFMAALICGPTNPGCKTNTTPGAPPEDCHCSKCSWYNCWGGCSWSFISSPQECLSR
eukprot:gnl/MRDRNA2_/MRDRNA2_127152_c0_seq1.p1 gnl/MRDRNA2_/MRDRNA2_127152_c0~~gnl/MRDRNA2_/MRDRNA2_127152_c0_seq1.p1  ORF type:complete len:198 (+),score=25.81 gnl/MRDRNA2_/MRDRNA2_127152_c0_seq1:169-762(+)